MKRIHQEKQNGSPKGNNTQPQTHTFPSKSSTQPSPWPGGRTTVSLQDSLEGDEVGYYLLTH